FPYTTLFRSGTRQQCRKFVVGLTRANGSHNWLTHFVLHVHTSTRTGHSGQGTVRPGASLFAVFHDDLSALVAVLDQEPEAERIVRTLASAPHGPVPNGSASTVAGRFCMRAGLADRRRVA